jgi:hypothetical protein
MYRTHDNGSYKYSVRIISGLYISVSPADQDSEICSFRVSAIFIGKSHRNKMTEMSGGYGPEYDGNSILVKLSRRNNTYVFIGDRILVFRAKSMIVHFESPIGNNDVSYPWAKDSLDNYYLFAENMIFREPRLKIDDPYTYYYEKTLPSF